MLMYSIIIRYVIRVCQNVRRSTLYVIDLKPHPYDQNHAKRRPTTGTAATGAGAAATGGATAKEAPHTPERPSTYT